MFTKTLAVFGGVIAVFLLLVVVAVLVGVSISNSEVRLRNEIAAQQKANEAVYDTMWKIIQQEAEVSDQYQKKFYEGFGKIIGSRYEKERGGALLSMITEANPKFDTGLFAKLMRSIEGQRTVFLQNQKRLLDLKAEHDNVRATFPGSLICGGRPAIEVVIITSQKTDDAFKKGKDDDTNLFKGSVCAPCRGSKATALFPALVGEIRTGYRDPRPRPPVRARPSAETAACR